MILRTVLLATLWLALAGTALAQPATLSGTVTRSSDGAPASGVTVVVRNAGNFALAGTVPVGVAGDWSLQVPAGSYRVQAGGAGFVDELYDNVPCDFGSCNFAAATVLSLAAGATRPAVDFALDPTGTITGTVRRQSDASALADVGVQAFALSGALSAGAISGADGSYAIEMPAGQYLLLTNNALGFIDEVHDDITCPASSCDPLDATTFTVTAGGTIGGADFALVRGGTISGRVTRSGGLPITDAGVTVEVFDALGNRITAPTVEPDGTWAVTTGLLPGSYRAVARPFASYAPQVYNQRACPQDDGNLCDVVGGDPIVLSAGNVASGVDFVLPRIAASLAGRVTRLADGSGFEGVSVLATRSDGQSSVASTDANGDWRIDALAPGSYQVFIAPSAGAELAERWPGQQCFSPDQCAGPGTPIVLAAGEDRAGIDAQLAPLALASITLRNADTTAAMRGELRVLLPTGSTADTVPVNSAQAVTVPVLNGGELRFAGASAECGPASDRVCLAERFPDQPCPNLRCDVAAGGSVVVPKGGTASAQLLLAPGASISGRVTEIGGAPIDGLPLELVSGADELLLDALTAGGDYRFDGLGAGPYFVRTHAPSQFINEIYDGVPCPNGSCSPALGTPLDLTVGATRSGVDFVLARGGGLSGEVRSELNGAALPGASIAIHDASGTRVALATSANDGSWISPVLADGDYTLTIDAPGFDAELYDNLPCPALACNPLTGSVLHVAAPATVSGISAILTPSLAALPARRLFLNRCSAGCTVTRGVDDSRTNRSSIVQGTRTIPPFARGDAAFNALVACMRAQFQRYNVDITTVDPGTATHFEMMVGGLPSDIGMSSGVLGVAPWAGGPLIPNAIAFTFAAQGIHGDPFELCVTTAHEAGHLMGLDHHLIAADHMSYLDAPEKSFVDATASCGEFAPRACAFGPTQNTDQRLRFTVGPRPLVFGDGFENLPPFTDRPQQRSGAPVAPFACGLDPRAPTLPAAIYRRPSGPVVDASEARRRP